MPAKKKRPAAKRAAKPAKAAAKKPKARKPVAAAKPKAKPKAKTKVKVPARGVAKSKARPAAAKSGAAKPRAAGKTEELVRDASVDNFMRAFAHPVKNEIERVRDLILGLRSDVREGVKWNAPSFLTTDYFATFNFFGQDAFRLVLHTGAVPKPAAVTGIKIDDPTKLLRWQAKDRAMIGFSDAADVQAKLPALEAVLRQWIAVMDTL